MLAPRPLVLDAIRDALADATEAEIAEALHQAADNRRSATLRHAAALLRGERRGGRPTVDDRRALAEIAERLAAGGVPAVVLRQVARSATANDDVESVISRLRRKLRSAKDFRT